MNIFVRECSGVRPCFVVIKLGCRLEIILESAPPHFGYARDVDLAQPRRRTVSSRTLAEEG
jgi:hypothetical protein